MEVDKNLQGKVALVTGGGSGLGAAICMTLAQSGIKTIVADINLDKAKSVANEIEKKGGKCHACRV